MAKPKKRPVLTHCRVVKCSHATAPWRVYYSIESEGKPHKVRKSFADENKAWAFAEEKDREISNHGVRYGDIPPEVRRSFDLYRDEAADLTALGVSVPRFEDLIATALSELRKKHHEAAENALTVAEAVESFIGYKVTRVKDRQLTDLKDRLKRFAQEFGTRSMQSIATEEIEKWLTSLRSRRNPNKASQAPLLSPLSRNHYRAALHALFGYAAAPARSWCSRNPVADLEPERVTTGEPEAYKPEHAASIMQTALDSKPELVPVLALGLFAGLRVSEAIEVDLDKITKDTEEFRVNGKTGPRLAPCTDSLKVWLFAQPRLKGKAWQQSPRKLVDEMQELFANVEVEQINNGARHSFISYRCAESKDIARVADECGNSVGTIKAHYRQLVTSAEASRYFAIKPSKKAKNVTPIGKGRRSA